MWEWLSFGCFAIAAFIHFLFFIAESFLLQKDSAYKKLKITPEEHKQVKPWAFNQGFYNLCLAIGTTIGLVCIIQLKVVVAGALLTFSALTMITAGVVLWFTVPSMRKWALVQAIPPMLGLIFIMGHVSKYTQSI